MIEELDTCDRCGRHTRQAIDDRQVLCLDCGESLCDDMLADLMAAGWTTIGNPYRVTSLWDGKRSPYESRAAAVAFIRSQHSRLLANA